MKKSLATRSERDPAATRRQNVDAVHARVMADPRIEECCPGHKPGAEMPFDPARMACGGFRTLVSI